MNIVLQFDNFFNENIDFSLVSSMVGDTSTNIHEKLFLDIFTKLDDDFFSSNVWKENYTCNGFVSRTIITPFCKLTFKRRYYMNKNKDLHDNFYYVDRTLNLPIRKHLTNEALALVFNMAIEVNSSYASKNAIPNVIISKQTVSNYQKNMTTIYDGSPVVEDSITPITEDIDVIYIEADEAHCNLQNEVSIDDSRDELKTHFACPIRTKHKNIINKLVLTHSGHNEPNLRLKRKSLANKRYFGGIHMDPTDLADNIYYSIKAQYDLSRVKYIFVSGDGANWIKSLYKALKSILRNSSISIISVLDKFHTNKALKSIFARNHSIINYIKSIFNEMTKERFVSITDAFFAFNFEHNITEDSFRQNVAYICNNIQEIKNQGHPLYNCHCAMEGQVSHILARRLTSRPAGFNEKVLQNLTQMIIFKASGNVITPDIVKLWSKDYLVHQKSKSNRIIKNWKRIYDCSVELPILNSTNTSVKTFFRQICHSKTY